MSKKKRKHRQKRMWLAPTDPDSKAWVAWNISSYSEDGEMDIQIADCFRNITLCLYNKRDERKIRKLIKFLQDAVDIHVQERDKDA